MIGATLIDIISRNRAQTRSRWNDGEPHAWYLFLWSWSRWLDTAEDQKGKPMLRSHQGLSSLCLSFPSLIPEQGTESSERNGDLSPFVPRIYDCSSCPLDKVCSTTLARSTISGRWCWYVAFKSGTNWASSRALWHSDARQGLSVFGVYLELDPKTWAVLGLTCLVICQIFGRDPPSVDIESMGLVLGYVISLLAFSPIPYFK